MSDDCECDICSGKESLGDAKAWEMECLKKHGWYSHIIQSGDSTTPTRYNYHTHGLPEGKDLQIVMPLPPDDAHTIAATIANRIKAGEDIQHGSVLDEVICNFQVRLVEAEDNGRRVLRIIFPDQQGKIMPWDMAEPYLQQYVGTKKEG